ncbi:hypothetical protein [Streptomyces collinus]|uniref:Uncharacterized protein n=1 Tax=Streptomyces collinus (strain DSM 40733 / Tue 365) TaxID=1214242 RepID=S5VFE6_STRC3|nr:hypothetical protein [Streptomyces collinus]AGS73954.1 hypothetical protein B446_35978 [Streptomyces collinus Tu 365]
MWTDVLILALPVVLVLGLGMAYAAWDTRRWEAQCRAASQPQPVKLFPSGPPASLAPKLDVPAARQARRARHARTTGVTR